MRKRSCQGKTKHASPNFSSWPALTVSPLLTPSEFHSRVAYTPRSDWSMMWILRTRRCSVSIGLACRIVVSKVTTFRAPRNRSPRESINECDFWDVQSFHASFLQEIQVAYIEVGDCRETVYSQAEVRFVTTDVADIDVGLVMKIVP